MQSCAKRSKVTLNIILQKTNCFEIIICMYVILPPNFTKSDTRLWTIDCMRFFLLFEVFHEFISGRTDV